MTSFESLELAPDRVRSNGTIRIVLVDDSEPFLNAATDALRSVPGVKVVSSFTSPSEALDHARAEKPEVVIADLVMPGINGLELTRLLKTEPTPPKVVLITLYDGPDFQTAATAAGADAYLGKSDFVQKLPGILRTLYPQGE